MENKMTDNEIIKALECCKNDDCDNCPNTFGNCYSNLAGYSLDFINRLQARVEKCERVEHFADKTIATQKAEIEKLQNTLDDVLDRQPVLVERAEKYAKAEAVKEFEERLKKETKGLLGANFIDNLASEVLGCWVDLEKDEQICQVPILSLEKEE